MKKIFILVLIGLVSLVFVSCNQTDEDKNNNLFIGHINIDNNTLYLDEIEWITYENKDRIKELELSQQSDMPNGYYIYNPSSVKIPFEITEKTVFNFIDWGNDFVDNSEDKNYSTTNQEEFFKYLNTYSDKAAKVPFWIETKDGNVLSVTEQFVN